MSVPLAIQILVGTHVHDQRAGKFLSVTFRQPHFRLPLLARPEYGWDVEARVIGDREDALPSYCYVATK